MRFREPADLPHLSCAVAPAFQGVGAGEEGEPVGLGGQGDSGPWSSDGRVNSMRRLATISAPLGTSSSRRIRLS
jgi:hypothetical protein